MTDARARDNDVAPLQGPRTEGQRALQLVPGSLSVIAGTIGVDKGTVSRWRAGEKLPTPAARSKLHAAYAIEPSAWDRAPLGASKTAPAREAATSDVGTRSTLDETLDAIDQVKTLLSDATIAASERKGLLDNLSKLLALRSRLEEKAERSALGVARLSVTPADVASGERPQATLGCGLVRGQLFTREGVLVASTAQEGLMRHRGRFDRPGAP